MVVFANGTGVHVTKYTNLLDHMSSWGFISIGNEDDNSWSGASSDLMLSYLVEKNGDPESVLYDRVDLDNVGITGHSQGGVAVFNAVAEQPHGDMYKAAVALSPTNPDLAGELGWPYDLSRFDVPVLMVAGTGPFDSETVTPLDKMEAMFDSIDAPKVMMRETGIDHGQMLYYADGYVTAWFMWHLQGDERAMSAFAGESPEVMSNTLYQDQRVDLT